MTPAKVEIDVVRKRAMIAKRDGRFGRPMCIGITADLRITGVVQTTTYWKLLGLQLADSKRHGTYAFSSFNRFLSSVRCLARLARLSSR